MNSINLLGRITADPVIRYSSGPEPKEVCSFSLAVPRDYAREGQQNVDYINCVAFQKTAAFLGKYIKKGNRIGVTGRFQSGKYVDREGRTVYTINIIVDHVYFADGRLPASKPEHETQPQQQKPDDPSDNMWTNAPEEGDPFQGDAFEADGDLPF